MESSAPAGTAVRAAADAEAERSRIRRSFLQGDCRNVLNRYEDLGRVHPELQLTADDLYQLGTCASRLVEDPRALQALTQFRQRFPGDPRIAETLLAAGLVAGRLGRVDEALAAFSAAAAAGKGAPLTLRALEEKADLLARLGRHLACLETYDQAWPLASSRTKAALERKIESVFAALPAEDLVRVVAGRYRFPIDAARRSLGTRARAKTDGARPSDAALPVRRIGVILPSRGPWGGYGTEARRGFDLCLEDPARELPFRLESVVREESSGQGVVEALVELADREKVLAVLGPLLSGNAEKLLPEAGRRSIAVITPTASSAQLEGESPVFFRTCLTLEAFGDAIAAFAVTRLGHPRFAFIVPAEDYARSFAAVVRRSLEKRGGRVIVTREYTPRLANVPDVVAGLREDLARSAEAPAVALPVDALFFAGSAKDAAVILPELAAQGLDPRRLAVVGGSGFNTPDFPRLAGAYAEGAFFADGFSAESVRLEAWGFTERYRERYGVDPGTTAAQACAAAEVLTEALRRGASSRAEVLARLGELRAVSTVLGTIRLFPGGRVERQPFFVTVSGGRLVDVGGEVPAGKVSPR